VTSVTAVMGHLVTTKNWATLGGGLIIYIVLTQCVNSDEDMKHEDKRQQFITVICTADTNTITVSTVVTVEP